FDHFLGQVFGTGYLRVGRCNVHGHITSQSCITTFELNQYSNTVVAVNIAVYHAVGCFQQLDTTNVVVLTDFLNQCLTCFFHTQVFNCSDFASESFFYHAVGKSQEVLVTGNEVGFGVDFNHHTIAAVCSDTGDNNTVSSSTAGFLGSFQAA